MRKYLEAREIVADEEDSEFIRADITGMDDAEKDNVLTVIKDVMSGKTYRLIEHACGHEDHEGCVTKEI